MAKVNYTVESVLESVHTGLADADEQKAFAGYLTAEIGALRKEMGDEIFGGVTLKGKGDKQKGTFTGGTYSFTGGHSVALLVIHFACLMRKQSDGLGILPVRADVSAIVAGWAAKRKRALKETAAEQKPAEQNA